MTYFKRSEFECKCGCGFDTVDYELAAVLDDIRSYFNSPVIINSGCRCESHNKAIGGSENSKHRLGVAADIVVSGIDADIVAEYLEQKYSHQYGIGRYNSWTHIDIRTAPARWDERT